MDDQELTGGSFAEEGVAYVPLAPLLEALGGWETGWDQPTRTATADTGLFSLSVPAGRSQVLADGFPFNTSAATLVRGGCTYVPLRSLASLLGGQ